LKPQIFVFTVLTFCNLFSCWWRHRRW